jgi:hypothetical protein
MDLRIKNALGIVGVVAIALATIAAWQWVGAFSRATTAGATFSVTGQGKSVGVPDVAQFSFSITNEGGKDIAALQKDNTAKTNAAIAYVKSQGVDAKDIETQDYNIQPRYQTYDCRTSVVYAKPLVGAPGVAMAEPASPCPPSSIVGYTVSQTVQVKVRDFTKTGDILAGVTAKGANNVSGLNFTTDDPTKLQNEARAKAIQNAKEQAEMMAKAGGFRLGRLISVSEGYNPQPYYSKAYGLETMSADSGGAPVPPPAIEPGSQQTNAQVTLTYEIQ